MTDLVDYLRDKLEHADDPVHVRCLCEQIEVGWAWKSEMMRGRTNPRCPIHGKEA